MYKLPRWMINLGQATDEGYRYVTMAVVLRLVAVRLPESWARMVARCMGFGLALSPFTGRWTYDAFRQAFGVDRWRSFQLARGWLTRPFLDHVILLRICHNLSALDDWELVELNAEPIRALLEAGESLIVATGHFAREGFWSVFQECVLPAFLLGVVAKVPVQRTLFGRRMRIQFGTILRSWNHVRPLNREWVVVGEGGSTMTRLVNELHHSGRVVVIAIDAHWPGGKPGTFVRPFAGQKARAFATGAARLARLTQTNVVSCIVSVEGKNRVVVDWGTPIPPPDAANEAADTCIMNQLLEPLEVAVGERPTQYVLPLGAERQWNSALRRWEDRQET